MQIFSLIIYDIFIDDCIQTCDCNLTLLNNGICDESCNNTQCQYDLFDCIIGNETCFYNYSIGNYNYNESNVAIDTTCYESWTLRSDQWCDMNCNRLECNHDLQQCNYCSGYCGEAHYILILLIAGISEPAELISKDDLCHRWTDVVTWTDFAQNYTNCSQMFRDWDINQNSFVGLHEAISTLIVKHNIFFFQDNIDWKLKLNQIDCSMCLNNRSLYYW